MKIHKYAIVATLLASGAWGAYVFRPATQLANVTIQLRDLDGAAFEGDARVYITQEDLSPLPAHGEYVWGPHLVAFTGGAGLFTANLVGLDDTRTVTVDVHPGGGSSLQLFPSNGFFLNPQAGARGQKDVLPISQAGGSVMILARGMSLASAPGYGSLQIEPSSPPVAGLSLHVASDFDNPLLFPVSAYPLSTSWPQGETITLYHWGTTSTIDVRAMAAGDWDSGVRELRRGQTLLLTLYNVGRIQVDIPPQVALDDARVIAIPIATHVPFTLPPGASHAEKLAASFLRVLGGIPSGESMQGALHDFLQLPPGDYVIEVWTKSGVLPNPPIDPAPYFVGPATVLSGSTTFVTVN